MNIKDRGGEKKKKYTDAEIYAVMFLVKRGILKFILT